MKRAARCAFQSISMRRCNCAIRSDERLRLRQTRTKLSASAMPAAAGSRGKEQQFRRAAEPAQSRERREGKEGERNGEQAAREGDLGQQFVFRRQAGGRGQDRGRAPERARGDGVERRAAGRDMRLPCARADAGAARPSPRNRARSAPPSGPSTPASRQAAGPKPDQQGRGANEMNAEQEEGDGIERADALARGALFLLVIDAAEIAHEQAGERDTLLRLGQRRTTLLPEPCHRRPDSASALTFV